jgi:uncharacterized RDD family membrane protein YckC
VAIVALLWVAALAGSSAPDGFGGTRDPEMPLVAGTVAHPASAGATADAIRIGKRWAMLAAPDGKRWDLPDESKGKRWS